MSENKLRWQEKPQQTLHLGAKWHQEEDYKSDILLRREAGADSLDSPENYLSLPSSILSSLLVKLLIQL